ncbi:MAG: DUF4140 domain-containing protein [Desulfosalsimonas sp.]
MGHRDCRGGCGKCGASRANGFIGNSGVHCFFNQARVARQASARVDPGVHGLVLPIGAFSIDRNSVTAEIDGKGEILGVRTTEVPVIEPGQEKIRELENRKGYATSSILRSPK